MKPNSITQFERLYLASILVWLVSSALSYGQTVAELKARSPGTEFGVGALVTIQILVCAIAAGLWFLIVRRHSALGKWILSIWFLISTCLVTLNLYATGLGFNLAMLTSLIAYGLGAWGLSYLFKPDAEAWLGKAPSA